MNRFYALVDEFKTKLNRDLESDEIKLLQWISEKEKEQKREVEKCKTS